MKLRLMMCSAVLAPMAALAQSGTVTVWPHGMPPGGMDQKADFGYHLLEVIHRDKDGQAELHKTRADVMVIQKGSATLVYGGEVIAPADSAPNEIRGSGIKGGQKIKVGPGDVIEIPVGLPHQFLLAAGTEITYLVVKVTKP